MKNTALLILWLAPALSHADVLLNTTIDCADWEQGTQLNCDGLEWPSGQQTVDGNKTTITSVANNPAGGGKGVRFWVGDGHNVNSASLSWNYLGGGALPPQKELWIRWYMRHEAGFRWDPLHFDKMLYIRTVNSIDAIPGFANGKYVLLAQGSPDYYQVATNYTWEDIMGGSVSDGRFHCYEIHLKMDTNGANGVGQVWIDGVLRASNTAVNWSNGNATAREGWRWFGFEENQNAPANGRAMSIDYDDMVVYNTPPPNRDAAGNPFIGLIGGGGGKRPSPPTGLRTQ
ncbi:MAG: hypothetical protein HY901_05365 [Deltaproteobacteria bacterium]|nr:hypothetical protein [Deltaproteobacteria bacterium]